MRLMSRCELGQVMRLEWGIRKKLLVTQINYVSSFSDQDRVIELVYRYRLIAPVQ